MAGASSPVAATNFIQKLSQGKAPLFYAGNPFGLIKWPMPY